MSAATSATTLPIWKESGLSLAAKLVWVSHHVGLPVSDDVLSETLAKLRQPYVRKEACLSELRAAGWLA
jgi:hypothetical protein